MAIIDVISKKQKGELLSVHLQSGVLVSGIFEGIEEGLLRMNNVSVGGFGNGYEIRYVLVDIDAVEMCLPGEIQHKPSFY